MSKPDFGLAFKPGLRRKLRLARGNYVAGLTSFERNELETSLAANLAANLLAVTTGSRRDIISQQKGFIAGYAARGGEIDPGLCDLYPRVGADMLTFHRCCWADLVPGYAGIAEPPGDTLVIDPDIIFVPLIAVDARGNRLGQGAGHYDRTLAALRARRRILAVGIAWDMQLIDAVPADPWDEPLDALATPSRWLDFGSHGG